VDASRLPGGPASTPGSGSRPDRGAGRADLGLYLTAGFQFGGVLLAFTGLGYWMDTRWHTIPLFTLLGVAVGGIGGFLHLYRSLTRAGSGANRDRSAGP
jgi:F0F1-type ATP synthase assembly protein I